MLEDLKDKRILVTGSSSGIGAGIAEAFGGCGARVIVHFNENQGGAEKTVRKIIQSGGNGQLVQADLTDLKSIRTAFDAICKPWDGIDVLVNNAGIIKRGAILDMEESDLDRVLSLNFKAPYLLSQLSAKIMIAEGNPGSIINISSIHGNLSFDHFSVYASSKAALNALTRIQALEWARHGIRVNAIAPGVTRVERSKSALSHYAEKWLSKIPLGRYGEVSEVGNLAVFLASEDAAYITGQIYTIDGGLLSRANLPHRENLPVDKKLF